MGLGGFLISLLVLGVAGDPLTIHTLPSSSAVLGSAALLKCRFNIGGPINLTALQVHWYFSDQRVAQYDRGEETFAPGVSISKQELRIGNASLGMENVQMSDEGQYTCVVGYGAERQESETTLRVLAAPRLSIPRRAARTDTATSFPCHVWGFYPGDVTITWLRDRRVLTDTTHSAPQRNPDGTFNLTLTHTFTPTANDSGSIFSCRVTHVALAQPLREEFPLDVTVPRTGADHTSTVIGVTLGILVAGGAAAALAISCWRQRRAQKGSYRALETPPEAPAGSRDKKRSEDTVGTGNDGVSDAGEGSEQQLLLHSQGQEQSETQEQDGAWVTASSNSSGSKASDVGPRASSWNTQGGPEAEGSSPNTEPLGETGALDEEGAGAASPQAQPVAEVAFPAQPSTAGEGGETDLNQHSGEAMVPTSQPGTEDQGAPSSQTTAAADTVPDPAQEEVAQGEAIGNSLLRPPEVSEISQPESVTAGEEITLSCSMTGHFPGDLSVTWLRRARGAGAAVPLQGSAEYRIEPGVPHTQDGKSFQQETRLSFTSLVQRDQGAEYVCRVGHVALQTPLERRSRELQVAGCADSAETKPSASENRGQEQEPASRPGGAAAVTGPLVEEGAGDTAPKGKAGGDDGAETNSESDTRRDTTMTQNDTARATPAKGGATSDASAEEQAGDNTTDVGTTSDVPAKEQAGDNTADEHTSSDASAEEQAGDNTADDDTTSELAEGFPGGARPAIGVVGDRVASTTPVTKVAADAVVGAPPAGGPDPEAEASATPGEDDADNVERVEEPGADGTADASPGNSEQTA